MKIEKQNKKIVLRICFIFLFLLVFSLFNDALPDINSISTNNVKECSCDKCETYSDTDINATITKCCIKAYVDNQTCYKEYLKSESNAIRSVTWRKA